ncbi:uncharacterized protein N7498_004236 [Penicillium cinerascens]|uniref:Uncharacterized protein n=1 Tax=Penicillium cinerascens TaxID=70096 RepID=A0A9W9N3I4_9EURO|nr:uncharacterized protein N7498_004236 [Penicillium cinerascens]KAJ5212590.1 hypothetical protein N7498_004236 [Penicillium cinerascens]
MIGNVVGFVPSATAQIVGSSINLASGLGIAATSIIRTKQYMKKANETVFSPRGLHAQICKTGKMLLQIGVRPENAQPEIASKACLVKRMSALGEEVMRLDFDVGAPVEQSNWMKKLGAYSAQRAEQNQLRKLDKKQGKLDKKQVNLDRKIARDEKRGRSPGRKSEKKENKEAEKRQNKEAEKRQNKEAEKVKGLLWIVITARRESLSGDDDWDSNNESRVQ